MKKRQILTAATELFIRSGYGSISMEQVSRHAKVSKATLYAYFTSKSELFMEVFTNYFADTQINYPQLASEARESAKNLDELKLRIYTYLHSAFDFYNNDRVVNLYRLLLSEINNFPELFALAFGPRGKMTNLLSNYLTDYATRNQVNSQGCFVLACQILDLVRGATLWPKLMQNPHKQKIFADTATSLKQLNQSVVLLLNYYFKENNHAK